MDLLAQRRSDRRRPGRRDPPSVAGSVLVIGDAMLDRYIYGEVGRLSPEAPVPVLNVQRELAMPGGAGNVARNLGALGVAAAFVIRGR